MSATFVLRLFLTGKIKLRAIDDFEPKLMNAREHRGFVPIMELLKQDQIKKDQLRFGRYEMRKHDCNYWHWIIIYALVF